MFQMSWLLLFYATLLLIVSIPSSFPCSIFFHIILNYYNSSYQVFNCLPLPFPVYQDLLISYPLYHNSVPIQYALWKNETLTSFQSTTFYMTLFLHHSWEVQDQCWHAQWITAIHTQQGAFWWKYLYH